MRDSLWLIWLGIAIAAAVIEVFSLDVIFIMVAGGALVAALAAALTKSASLSILVFAGATLLLLLAARPPLKVYLQRNLPTAPMHHEALVGRTAEVVAAVDAGTGGRIRIGGELWSARADQPIPAGATVYVHRIDGATAVVGAEPLPPSIGPPV